MSIWNKVLLGLIFVAAVAFFYLGARTLKTHQHWRERAQEFEERIAALDEENVVLVAGVEREGRVVEDGIRQLKIELEKLLLDRGRAWTECTPQGADPQTGQVHVVPGAPSPHGLVPNTVLFVFEGKRGVEEEVENRGRYLGQFKVVPSDDGQVDRVRLEPSQEMTPEQRQRLAASRGFWVMYDVMPIDNHYLFERLSEEEKRALLPASTVEEYIRDGQEATWDDLDAWGAGGLIVDEEGKPLLDEQGERIAGAKGIYRRQLRDYRSLMDLYHKQRTLLVDLRESAERDLQYLTAALQDAERQVAFRQREVAGLKADLAKYRAERDAVVAHHKAVQQKLDELNRGIGQLLADNRAKASHIAQIQYEATRQIDARTRAMGAQPAEGGD
jgi:hypothetical protein